MHPQFIVWVGLGFALAYLPMTDHAPSALRSAIKTVPVAAFALAGWLAGAPLLLVGALALSALGDLALSRGSERTFLIGLASFALAHLAYVTLFIAMNPAPLWRVLVDEPVLVACLIGLGASAEFWLMPHTHRFTWPVRIYVALIVAMGIAALALGRGPVAAGAALFILSDMVLSLLLFRIEEDHPLASASGWLVWCFYIAGQSLILAGAA